MMNSKNNPDIDELESLLFDADSGELDSPGVLRAREILKSSEAARQWFVHDRVLSAAMFLEGSSGLGDEIDLPDDALSRIDPAFSAAGEAQPNAAKLPADKAKSRIPWRMLLAIAATGLLMVWVGRWSVLPNDVQGSSNGNSDLGGQTSIATTGTQTNQNSSASDRSPADHRLVASSSPKQSANSLGQGEPTSQGIALVTRLVDAQWQDSEDSFRVGDAVSPGPMSLKSGFAQIEFFCGATVVLEGPAELEMLSATQARFRHGRLRAQVPPAARGFEILMDEMKVVDLGTEFGISLSPDHADVQVFDGEVEVHRPEHQMKLLEAGQSLSRRRDGSVGDSVTAPNDFIDIETLDVQAESQTTIRRDRWRAYSEKLRRDDRVIAYYAIDDGRSWARKLPCSNLPANPDLAGAIVGAAHVEGRWPGKSAIEFKRPGDRVRVDIPGEFGSLTMACWVKIDSLDRWYNSLFLTDNYERGKPHWQILDTGQLFFSVRVSDENVQQEHREVVSPPFWKPSMSGQWLHLATTHDVHLRRTTHYLNGEMLSEATIPKKQLVVPTRIGKASIGNWSVPTKPDAKFAIRNLNGSIDEFVVFSEALAADEIQQMYENGKP
ncbi:FecR protein [Rubripirellula lacrimiformis]|uniref:FecR protein n=1 Tax=Rubripirellula lacrimiformis TaxID=1930273 RepID=A0A517N6V7_9BACT|nr:LamG-like jellyroll fold domain-containing protein [Rubripirellula lacrimiformis]QDT02851.1 FecR protein [Rubripirellula lacrimiformis]